MLDKNFWWAQLTPAEECFHYEWSSAEQNIIEWNNQLTSWSYVVMVHCDFVKIVPVVAQSAAASRQSPSYPGRVSRLTRHPHAATRPTQLRGQQVRQQR